MVTNIKSQLSFVRLPATSLRKAGLSKKIIQCLRLFEYKLINIQKTVNIDKVFSKYLYNQEILCRKFKRFKIKYRYLTKTILRCMLVMFWFKLHPPFCHSHKTNRGGCHENKTQTTTLRTTLNRRPEYVLALVLLYSYRFLFLCFPILFYYFYFFMCFDHMLN